MILPDMRCTVLVCINVSSTTFGLRFTFESLVVDESPELKCIA